MVERFTVVWIDGIEQVWKEVEASGHKRALKKKKYKLRATDFVQRYPSFDALSIRGYYFSSHVTVTLRVDA